MNILEISKNKLINKIGRVVPYWYCGDDCVMAYINGVIPIKIKTDLSQEEFNNLINGGF